MALFSLIEIIILIAITIFFIKFALNLKWLAPIYLGGFLIWIFKKINLEREFNDTKLGWMKNTISWYENAGWQFIITIVAVGILTYLIWKFTDRY